MIILDKMPIPPSSNASYRPARIGKTGRMRFVSTNALIVWKNQMDHWSLRYAQDIRKAQEWSKQENLFHVDCEFYFPYDRVYTKKGKPRKFDTSNLLKALHDKVCQILEIDDCLIFDGSFKKRHHQSEHSYCKVIIQKLDL